MRFTAVQEQPKFRNTKHSAKYIEKYIALDATDTVAQPGQVQVDNQWCHTANRPMTCDRGASPYFKAIHGEPDCRSCR